MFRQITYYELMAMESMGYSKDSKQHQTFCPLSELSQCNDVIVSVPFISSSLVTTIRILRSFVIQLVLSLLHSLFDICQPEYQIYMHMIFNFLQRVLPESDYKCRKNSYIIHIKQ
jgi:hypothetical protein